MKLYSHPGSCSSATEICLREAGADFEHIRLDLHGDRQLPDGRNFNDVNPKGYVPVLELDNGELLTENVAILQYIADQYPDAKLAPPNNTLERTRVQEWLGYLNSEVHKTCGPLIYPNIPDEVRDSFRERLNKRLKYIDEKLANQDYLSGDQFSIADAYFFIILGWAPMFAFDLSPYPNITAYQERLAERDSIKQTLATMAG